MSRGGRDPVSRWWVLLFLLAALGSGAYAIIASGGSLIVGVGEALPVYPSV